MSETVPTTPVEAATLVLLVPCGQCWQPPGVPCAPEGQHLARYARAERKGLLADGVMAAIILAAGPVFSAAQIIPDVTP